MVLDAFGRVPRTSPARHVSGTVLAVTDGVATVRVTDRRAYRVRVPVWTAAVEDAHTHDLAGPQPDDDALLLIVDGADDVWLVSWRRPV